jgi:hypothetical protein
VETALPPEWPYRPYGAGMSIVCRPFLTVDEVADLLRVSRDWGGCERPTRARLEIHRGGQTEDSSRAAILPAWTVPETQIRSQCWLQSS